MLADLWINHREWVFEPLYYSSVDVLIGAPAAGRDKCRISRRPHSGRPGGLIPLRDGGLNRRREREPEQT
jgi:hypothetical protein